MGSPRKKWPQFTPANKKIPLGLWNDLLRTVEGLDGLHSPEGYRSREIQAPAAPPHTIMRLVELDEAIGPDESSEFRDRRGTVMYWDSSNLLWKRTDPAQQISVITDGFEHLVQDEGQRLAVWYHAQSGKYLPVNPNTMRQVKTCKDKGGYYPVREDCPNVYPIVHITSSYPLPPVGDFLVTPTHTEMSSISRLSPDTPHGGKAEGEDVTGYVFNLATGENGGDGDSYIPEGNVVPAWFHNGQWWTYWIGEDECLVSSTSSPATSKSCSSCTSGVSTSASSESTSSLSSSTTESSESTSASCTTLSSESTSSESTSSESTSCGCSSSTSSAIISSSMSSQTSSTSISCTTTSEQCTASSSPSSEKCTVSSPTSSSEKCTESTNSSTRSSASSLDLWHVNVVTDVCCDDSGNLVVVTQLLDFRFHPHSGGYVLINIGDREPADQCLD